MPNILPLPETALPMLPGCVQCGQPLDRVRLNGQCWICERLRLSAAGWRYHVMEVMTGEEQVAK